MAKNKKNQTKYDAAHIFVIGLILSGIVTFALAASVCMGAEVLSEHNEQHVAENAAMGRLFDAGCKRTEIVRVDRFRLIDAGVEFIIFGNKLKVVCLEYQEQTFPVQITWDTPHLRTDGSILFSTDIREYRTYINGQFSGEVSKDLNSVIVHLGAGSYEINMTTVDTSGLESAYSTTAHVRVD